MIEFFVVICGFVYISQREYNRRKGNKQWIPRHVHPRGRPSKALFRMGAIGCLLSAFALPVLTILLVLETPLSLNYFTYFGFIGSGIAFVLQSIGVYGFYKNYGVRMGLVTALLEFIVFLSTLVAFPLQLNQNTFSPIISVYLLVLMFILYNALGITFYKIGYFQENPDKPFSTALVYFFMGFITFAPNLMAAYVFAKIPHRFVYE